MICRSYDLHHKKSTIYLIFLKGLNIILFLINKLLFFKRGFFIDLLFLFIFFNFPELVIRIFQAAKLFGYYFITFFTEVPAN